MATSPGSKKKKGTTARSAKVPTVRHGTKALENLGLPKEVFGRLNKDGSHTIDPKALETLKQKVGKERWSKVRFVAMNAPFKRRSPTPST